MGRIFRALVDLRIAWTKRKIKQKLKGKQIYVVFGLRRSGNHAIIKWLMNASQCERVNYEYYNFRQALSDNGKVLFLNNWNGFHDWRSALANVDVSKNVEVIFISFEDINAIDFVGEVECTIPNYSLISITRKRLDLVASRYETLYKRALAGKDERIGSNMNCDKRLSPLIRAIQQSHYFSTQVHYDSWLDDVDYRHVILEQLNLSCDIMPDKGTSEGGGSSFADLSGWSEDRLLKLSNLPAFIDFYKENYELTNEEFQRITALEDLISPFSD